MAKILIADDDPRLLKMLVRTLTYEGFDVLSAGNGLDALAAVHTARPDIVVLDWLMPGLDGVQVVQCLRAAGDETLVVMLTARDSVEDRRQALESGADDYIVKPFAPADLVAHIRALGSRYAGRQAGGESIRRAESKTLAPRIRGWMMGGLVAG